MKGDNAMKDGISRFYIRHYRDSGQTVAYCEWTDGARTEGQMTTYHAEGGFGDCCLFDNKFGIHMTQLAMRAIRDGLTIETEVW